MSNSQCPNCSNNIKQNSGTPCDGCRMEVHLSCVGLNADDVRITRNKSKSIKILCANCVKLLKEIDDLKSNITSLRKEVNLKFACLEAKMSDTKVSDISEIKTSIDSLRKDINNVKSVNVPPEIKDIKVSIDVLKNDIEELKSSNSFANANSAFSEEIIHEMSERERRKKNIVIFGLPERLTSSSQDRTSTDLDVVKNILSLVDNQLANAQFKIFRLGKVRVDYNRPIKVILEDETQAQAVIRKAAIIRNSYRNVSVSLDRTPRQSEYYKKVRSELQERLAKGEQLKIRYINGLPKIVPLN